MMPYVAESIGYMHVNVGDRIELLNTTFESGEQDNLYSTYAYGRKLPAFAEGWFPVHVLHDVQTQLEIAGVQTGNFLKSGRGSQWPSDCVQEQLVSVPMQTLI